MEQNINALNEVQKSCKSYNTRSQRRENKNDEFYKIGGMMLTGMKRSAGSIIKTEAIKRAKTAKAYANLDKEQKNIVMLGLNSICDLSNNSDSRGSQKFLFTKEAWKQLKNNVYVSREMPHYLTT
ncbi:unnamed protein product [Mucor hiemalis]